jgi:hypothetical protein
MQMAAGSSSAGGNCTGTKVVATAALEVLASAPPPRR